MSVASHRSIRFFSAGEATRLVVLAAVAAWILHPFATNRQIGSGDALWYANMLADFVTQWRAGFFPVFAGQTEYAFNGAVYPLRVAPLYQHVAGILDLLTGHRLVWFGLQHLTVIACGVAGIFGCYFLLCALAPRQRWTAVGLATLYLSCPGVLGTVFTQDLYMTWMTIPFVPLAFYGVMRSFESDDLIAQACLASGLALLWLGHAPIALWTSFLVGGIQLARLLFVHRTAAAWKRASAGAVLFLILGNYPFVSVATLHTPGVPSAVTSSLAHEDRIVRSVREAFPQMLRPLTENAGTLGDLQLGYGLWLVAAGAFAASFFVRRWDLRLLLAASAVLLLLIIPVPGVTAWAWQHLPEQVKRITYYWPMQRFYVLLAAMTAMAGQIAFESLSAKGRRGFIVGSAVLAAAGGWSLWESRQFVHAGQLRTATAKASARAQRPENFVLMNHAYGLFSALPPYFSNGVMDPRAELRLVDPVTQRALPGASGKVVQSGSFVGVVDANPGILNLSPTLALQPGNRYELTFTFLPKEYRGVLQLQGRSLFREYGLPNSGQSAAFGGEAPNTASLPLWTTDAAGDEVLVRFIPSAPDAKPADFAAFAEFRLQQVDPASAAINVNSLMPLRVSVRADQPAWLETPRMFMAGYEARVDGKRATVERTAQLLAAIPLEPGLHEVELRYVGPLMLRLAYGGSLAAWVAFLIAALVMAVRYARTPTPAHVTA